jgi:hypothetical protein
MALFYNKKELVLIAAFLKHTILLGTLRRHVADSLRFTFLDYGNYVISHCVITYIYS